ncbi:hypothetical protein [Methylobacterium sp. Leaf125]|uniref:hypothetical protein n=1 Tax=Methylobacterium sp. Leaf125 TaxID=1736265 RepID=UPI0012E22C64|nr:hypothetical protein [Methylobacterium sp. Leaf125]
MLAGYDRVWLSLDLPTSGRVTIARPVSGGNYVLYEGDVDLRAPGPHVRTLSADHKAKTPTLSGYLLNELGIVDRRIDRTLLAEKSAFTIRHFAPYVLTDETSMMAEWTPIQLDRHSGDTLDRNVFKFLLTGIDGSATVATEDAKTQRRGNAGKLELIDELIGEANVELQAWPDSADLSDQEERISVTLASVGAEASYRQERIDALRANRRIVLEEAAALQDRLSEIVLTLGRFDLLASVYDNDITRLAALAEGGAALLAGSKRTCPHCGAAPEDQPRIHGLEEVEKTYTAVQAEVAKVRSEQADLQRTIATLIERREDLDASIVELADRVLKIEASIVAEQPLESSTRASYERLDQAREHIRRGLSVVRRIEDLQSRRVEIAAFKPTTVARGSVSAGVAGPVGDEFAEDVQAVLHAWQFPGAPRVSFDAKTHDILLNGENRRGNGKGVRALMHAAFKIAVLVYCRRHGRPHPGIIALDSPLLSFRDPHTSKHGELSEDEKVLNETQLKHHFYEYLIRTSGDIQYVIIENDAPPIPLGDDASITVFAGERGIGDRKGFFLV